MNNEQKPISYDVPREHCYISEGKLLGLLTASFYILFTLLPNSHSFMVAWPWVVLWQGSLLCPILWLLWLIWHQRTFSVLGNSLDWCILLLIIGLIVSTIWAEFPYQALWYSWSILGFIAALYALNYWFNSPERRYLVMVRQGYLNLIFIGISLSLWISQTLLPELAKLNSFKQYGINLPFDFSVLELRNWVPLGHQNYVAGYLLLSLPLLVGLTIIQTGWKRWLWLTGVGFGLIDLYTTSSRGGWLGLVILCVIGFIIAITRSSFPKYWLGLGGLGTITTLSILILFNNRLRTLIIGIFNGKGSGELAYRIINTYVGGWMGSSHPWSGIGLGGVPILYQKYRPIWSGRQSELAFQLHSTPVQLWAEMGLWGIIVGLLAIASLIYLLWRWLSQNTNNPTEQILVWSIYASLLGYSVMSLTDFQLDNIAISGTLVLFLAYLASIFRDEQNFPLPSPSLPYIKGVVLLGLGIVCAVTIWLIPIHRAWYLSHQGFLALAQKEQDFDTFVENLTKAQQLVPWESYYPYQLGWNLGNLALQTSNPQQQQQLFTESITWLEKGIEVSPYQEFGHSNLAWLLLARNPKAATQAFTHSIELVPAKQGVMYGLGLSLLAQEKVNLAVEAITLEILRYPLFITSPIWHSPHLQSIYSQVTKDVMAKYAELLQQHPHDTYLHRCQGGLSWWQGDLETAHQELETYGTPLSQIVLELAEGKDIEQKLSQLPQSATKLVIMAWLQPSQRLELLQQAWIIATKTILPSNIEQELLTGMENSASFDQWLKKNNPVWRYRRERTGFGVLSRHTGGSAPKDFWTIVENIAMINWFSELLPSPTYIPELDLSLQPQRELLIQKILED